MDNLNLSLQGGNITKVILSTRCIRVSGKQSSGSSINIWSCPPTLDNFLYLSQKERHDFIRYILKPYLLLQYNMEIGWGLYLPLFPTYILQWIYLCLVSTMMLKSLWWVIWLYFLRIQLSRSFSEIHHIHVAFSDILPLWLWLRGFLA